VKTCRHLYLGGVMKMITKKSEISASLSASKITKNKPYHISNTASRNVVCAAQQRRALLPA
jgi:hypothetical protein